MNRSIQIVALFITTLLFAACGTAPEKKPGFDADDHRAEAPDWYLEHEAETRPGVIYGYGISPANPDHPDAMRRTARNRALNDVAVALQNHQRGLMDEYVEQFGGEVSEQLAQTLETFVDVELTGAEIDRAHWDSQGRWFVRVALDLDQDFEPLYEVLEAGSDSEREAVRRRSEAHLERLNERRAEQRASGLSTFSRVMGD
ncbi:hypothetical protein VCB98_11890 [Gammaproteobacteria bacterium AB-CW1]|uniref:LPP20 lipoprotein n=1 Tax=Natronospira elongata TaxID=3110268 RepID=A0AAP6MKK8_9GAMM|nr:hypothetical protein [Gammaproteobacteria bacterium AB-CW1]